MPLKESNITSIEATELKGKETTYSYLITLSHSTKLDEVRKVEGRFPLGKLAHFMGNKNDYTQCHKCQSFGHRQSNCLKRPRCVKCPGFHPFSQCKLERTENINPMLNLLNNDFTEIIELINSLISLKEAFKNTTDQIQRLTLLSEFLENF